ncbi:MAG: hypothetical protein WCC87_21915 [Candidatus Korobacteraceae bacterium]
MRKLGGEWYACYLALLTFSLLLWGRASAQSAQDRLCDSGHANCLLDRSSNDGSAESLPFVSPSHLVTMDVRTRHAGFFAHHWIEVESSHGPVTLGFGPATIPFIDIGQISVQDAHGHIDRRSWTHLFSIFYRYAEVPGAGYTVGQPIQLTLARSDAIVEKQRHRKFVFPYIPLFHDCRTYTCTLQAAAQGKSSLPCYVLFKGYW